MKANKRKDKISLKWKVFFVLLAFTGVLLFLVWLFQIVYLDDFYKLIKRRETEKVLDEAEDILKDSDDVTTDIEQLAAQNSMAVYVTDAQGDALFNAEYIPNSRMGSLTQEQFDLFYQSALENGGETVVEYQGSKMKDMLGDDSVVPPDKPTNSEGENVYQNLPEEFVQNRGMDRAQSVIYIKIITVKEQERVLMVNAVLTPVDATVSTLKVQLFVISLTMLAFAVITALIASRWISKSIIQVNSSARKLAQGEFDISFDGRDYREIAQLSDTLNYAAGELKKTEDLRRELIANVSHDLRTPLTMIKAYSEVMRDIPGENTPENVQVIIDESQRLTNLVNDMLDISKLQAKTVELQVADYNLTDSIRKVLQRYHKLKEQDGYIFEFQYKKEIIIAADEDKIYQVIYNLMNNAINYTGEDKRIMVRQILHNDMVRVEVEDTGDGIESKNIPYVWDRYYKVDKEHKRAIQGTGLGLSIVKKILDLHHAAYGVISNSGQGALFWFELPVKEEL